MKSSEELIADAADCTAKVFEAQLATLTPSERAERRYKLYRAIEQALSEETLNPPVIADMLRTKQGDMTLKQFAKSINCTASYVSDIYNGRRTPGPTILNALGISKETSYRKRWR